MGKRRQRHFLDVTKPHEEGMTLCGEIAYNFRPTTDDPLVISCPKCSAVKGKQILTEMGEKGIEVSFKSAMDDFTKNGRRIYKSAQRVYLGDEFMGYVVIHFGFGRSWRVMDRNRQEGKHYNSKEMAAVCLQKHLEDGVWMKESDYRAKQEKEREEQEKWRQKRKAARQAAIEEKKEILQLLDKVSTEFRAGLTNYEVHLLEKIKEKFKNSDME